MRRASRTVAIHASAPRHGDRVGGGRAATPPRSSSPRSPPRTPTCRPAPVRTTATAAEAFVDVVGAGAATRPSSAPGTFERRSEVTGSVDQLGGRARAAAAAAPAPAARRGRRARRPAPAPVPERPRRRPSENECSLGEPTGPTYDEDVASEVAALRHAVRRAPRPVYSVAASAESGCFDLVAAPRRAPRARSATEATLLLRHATGAPTNSRVAYEGGIVEVVAVTGLRRRGHRRRPRAVRCSRGDGGHGMVPVPWDPVRCSWRESQPPSRSRDDQRGR